MNYMSIESKLEQQNLDGEDEIPIKKEIGRDKSAEQEKEIGYGLSIESDNEKEWEKEWNKRYKNKPEAFLDEKNIEEIEKLSSAKRSFFLKMAKFHLGIDSDEIGDKLALDVAKAEEEMIREGKKQRKFLENLADNDSERLYKGKDLDIEEVFADKDEESQEKKEQLDLEIKKAIDEEEDILNKVWAEKDSKTRIQMIKNNIADIISEFEKGEKDKKAYHWQQKNLMFLICIVVMVLKMPVKYKMLGDRNELIKPLKFLKKTGVCKSIK